MDVKKSERIPLLARRFRPNLRTVKEYLTLSWFLLFLSLRYGADLCRSWLVKGNCFWSLKGGFFGFLVLWKEVYQSFLNDCGKDLQVFRHCENFPPIAWFRAELHQSPLLRRKKRTSRELPKWGPKFNLVNCYNYDKEHYWETN